MDALAISAAMGAGGNGPSKVIVFDGQSSNDIGSFQYAIVYITRARAYGGNYYATKVHCNEFIIGPNISIGVDVYHDPIGYSAGILMASTYRVGTINTNATNISTIATNYNGNFSTFSGTIAIFT